ncbi:60S ribosomal protein L12-like isoform 1 [Camelus ferus]|nr:60S ribosomal protein L12-like isoform 1 [Camelus ferus]
MLPKFDPNEIKVVYLMCPSEETGATSALAPKIGPLGLSPKKARELSGTMKEIPGTAQPVGCNAGGHHPHSITEDISSGALDCPTVVIKAAFAGSSGNSKHHDQHPSRYPPTSEEDEHRKGEAPTSTNHAWIQYWTLATVPGDPVLLL